MDVLIDASALHPSTRLALAGLEWLEERIHPQNILDLGCGNGILSLVSAQLWDASILACDIAENAVADARANIQRYGQEGRIEVAKSDMLKHPRIRAGAPYDLIIANLLAQWQIAAAADIKSHLSPDGALLLSGILLWQKDSVRDALQAINMEIIQSFEENEWHGLIATPLKFTEL